MSRITSKAVSELVCSCISSANIAYVAVVLVSAGKCVFYISSVHFACFVLVLLLDRCC